MFENVGLAIIPVGLVIFLGYMLNRAKFVDEHFWQGAEKISYYILLPSLFVYSLSNANIEGMNLIHFSSVFFFSTLTLGGLLFLAERLNIVNIDGASFSSVYQGAVRYNNYIGVTVASVLFGNEGIVLSAVTNAVLIPTANIMCIIIFAKYGTTTPTVKGVFVQILKNPLIIACALGSFLQLTSIGLPAVLNGVLLPIGKAALPLGLLCVGAALQLGSMNSDLKRIALASSLKLVVLPCLGFIISLFLSLTQSQMVVAALFLALPTASSSYILSRQLGGNAQLMARIIAVETVFSIMTLPVVLQLIFMFTG